MESTHKSSICFFSSGGRGGWTLSLSAASRVLPLAAIAALGRASDPAVRNPRLCVRKNLPWHCSIDVTGPFQSEELDWKTVRKCDVFPTTWW
eukprot:4561371-Prymnesium_polylepis.1